MTIYSVTQVPGLDFVEDIKGDDVVLEIETATWTTLYTTLVAAQVAVQKDVDGRYDELVEDGEENLDDPALSWDVETVDGVTSWRGSCEGFPEWGTYLVREMKLED